MPFALFSPDVFGVLVLPKLVEITKFLVATGPRVHFATLTI